MFDAFGQPQSLVVFGGTSEIAGAIVRALAGRRCRTVVLGGRDQGRLTDAAGDARRAGATRVETVVFDALDLPRAEGAVDECFQAAGDVDMVLMALGVLSDRRSELDPGRTAEILSAGYTWPVVALTRAAVRLREQGTGRIVVLSSATAVRVRRANFVYGSAKAGLDAFSIGLGEALLGTGVGVQVVRPGFVHTKMTAGLPSMPLATTPEAVAADVMKGLASGAAVVWSPRLLGPATAVLRNAPQVLWRRISA